MNPKKQKYFKSLHKLFEIPEINLMMFSLLETYCYYNKVHIYECMNISSILFKYVNNKQYMNTYQHRIMIMNFKFNSAIIIE